jgi:hypothetical protein
MEMREFPYSSLLDGDDDDNDDDPVGIVYDEEDEWRSF